MNKSPIPEELAELHKRKDYSKPFEESEEQQNKTLTLLNILHDDERKQHSFIHDMPLKYPQPNRKDAYNLSVLAISAKRGPVLDIALTLRSHGVNVTFIDLNSAVTSRPHDIKFPQYVFNTREKDVDTFYHQNQNNALLKSVDAFLCVYPIVLCELFQPFQKPFILYIEDRYEAGSHHYHEWKLLNDFIVLTSHDPKSSILASNVYDEEYVRYFTGLVPKYVPHTCTYLQSVQAYKPNEDDVRYLVWASADNKHLDWFMEQLRQDVKFKNLQIHVSAVSELSSERYRASLRQYSAVIVFPHQVSFLAFTELYRMNIPLFVPSLDLITTWHQQHHVLLHKG